MKRYEVIKTWIKWHRQQVTNKTAVSLLHRFRVEVSPSLILYRPRAIVKFVSI